MPDMLWQPQTTVEQRYAFPGQIHDIKAAVRFLRGNAEKYKLDTSFIGISGSSSGDIWLH
jgi:acetyl esterase/lipase